VVRRRHVVEQPGVTTAIAAFDFDGTITSRDTILPFLRAAVGTARLVRGAPFALPVLCGRGSGLLGPTPTKEWLFRIYVRGIPVDEMRDAARRFAADHLPRLIRPEARRRLQWHQDRGDRCVVVTASPELYVAPWAASEGLEAIGTRLAVDASGRLTGRYDGLCCDGAEKARRLREAIGPDSGDLYAYGDSRGDRALLAMARHAYWRVMPQPGVE
jgi:HAD superfamily hydrolase (TIGR01490 family)